MLVSNTTVMKGTMKGTSSCSCVLRRTLRPVPQARYFFSLFLFLCFLLSALLPSLQSPLSSFALSSTFSRRRSRVIQAAQWGDGDNRRPFKNRYERDAQRELLRVEQQVESQLEAVRSKLAGQQARWQKDVERRDWSNLVVPAALALGAATLLSAIGGSLLFGLIALPVTLAFGIFGGVLSLLFLPFALFSGLAFATVMATGALFSLLPLALLGGASFYLLRNFFSPSQQGNKGKSRRSKSGVYEVEVETTDEEDELKREAFNELKDFDAELRRREARRRESDRL